jgi:streptogramin lyase
MLLLGFIAVFSFLSSCLVPTTISGVVKSGERTLASAKLTLYRIGKVKGPQVLGRTFSNSDGFFTIHYNNPLDPDAVLYLIADLSPINVQKRSTRDVRFATVFKAADAPLNVVINERTTVATAYTMAQFIDGARIQGFGPGPGNSAGIFRNLVNVHTGEVSRFLTTNPDTNPNVGTSTLPTFNSLANLLAVCVNDESECGSLFNLTTPPGGNVPRDTLQAAVNIVHYPGSNADALFTLSQGQSIYQPAIDPNDPDKAPDAWTLALLYDGNGIEFDGPGNIAFDKDGNAWVNNNYAFNTENADLPDVVVCGSTEVFKLTPTGDITDFGGIDNSPKPGDGAGGLYGAGFGITLDPDGFVWVSNFGFQGTNCPYEPTDLFRSVSQFKPDGVPLSPDGDPTINQPGGYQGHDNVIQAPQGIKSDQNGNIWMANCATDSVTRFQHGNPSALGYPQSDNFTNIGVQHPFDIAFDTAGHAWVTSNGNSSVVELDTEGKPIDSVSDGVDRPMGIASDSFGNLWVADAGVMNPPCPGAPSEENVGDDGGLNERAAATLIDQRSGVPVVTTFGKITGKRDGLRWPWGIAVDGNDNVWVANFAGQRVMELCGVGGACPPGVGVGDPISPDSGYPFDGLARNTGIQIDPSGNVWLANNWLLDAFTHLANPGGHQVVVFIGLAKPVKTPLIGTPRTYF